MAAYFEENASDGFTSWMSLQSQEELGHAVKFPNYLLDRGATVRLPAIAVPKIGYTYPLEAFKTSLEQEISATKSIHALYKLAHQLDDFAIRSFLKYFADEQIEEGGKKSDKIKRAGSNPDALLMINHLAGECSAKPEK